MKKSLVGFIISLLILPAWAEVNNEKSDSLIEKTKLKEENKEEINDDLEYRKLIEEYKTYLHHLSEKVKKEIADYRAKLLEINKNKKNLYNKLSLEAQNHLKKEQEFKKRLMVQSK